MAGEYAKKEEVAAVAMASIERAVNQA